jgi:hypothetical protein
MSLPGPPRTSPSPSPQLDRRDHHLCHVDIRHPARVEGEKGAGDPSELVGRRLVGLVDAESAEGCVSDIIPAFERERERGYFKGLGGEMDYGRACLYTDLDRGSSDRIDCPLFFYSSTSSYRVVYRIALHHLSEI